MMRSCFYSTMNGSAASVVRGPEIGFIAETLLPDSTQCAPVLLMHPLLLLLHASRHGLKGYKKLFGSFRVLPMPYVAKRAPVLMMRPHFCSSM